MTPDADGTVMDFVDWVRDGAPIWTRQGKVPADLFERLGDTGFFADRWRNGRQSGIRSALDLIDVLAPVDGGVALAVSLHAEVFLAVLHRFHSNSLVAGLLPEALTGRVVGAFGLTEDGGGSDPARATSKAVETDSGSWHLTGHKRYVSNLDCATHCLVLAGGQGRGRQGPTMFLLDLALPGVERVGPYDKLGTRSVVAGRLIFDTEIPATARLGPVGGALTAILPALRYERLAVSRAVVSGARYALGLSAAYLRGRPGPHGRLYDQSALAHSVAEAWIRLEAAESYLERVVSLDLAGRSRDGDYAALKHFCAQTSVAVADSALQLMGGRGYTTNYPHERIWRDARLARIGAGTDELMLEVVARTLDRASGYDLDILALQSADQPDTPSETET